MSSFRLLATLNLCLGGLVFLLGLVILRENPRQRLNRVADPVRHEHRHLDRSEDVTDVGVASETLECESRARARRLTKKGRELAPEGCVSDLGGPCPLNEEIGELLRSPFGVDPLEVVVPLVGSPAPRVVRRPQAARS